MDPGFVAESGEWAALHGCPFRCSIGAGGASGMTRRRLVATKWQTGGDGKSAAEAATEQAGW